MVDDRLLKALFDMNMKANEKDVHKAIQCLPDTRVTTLKLILSKATVSHVSLNHLCKEAMDSRKVKFTAVLVERGATPPYDELRRLCGWPRAGVEPAIANYLAAPIPPRPTPAAEKRPPDSSKVEAQVLYTSVYATSIRTCTAQLHVETSSHVYMTHFQPQRGEVQPIIETPAAWFLMLVC